MRRIGELEPEVGAFLAQGGLIKVATKEHLFILKPEGLQVAVTMKETRAQEGEPFMSFPEAVRLFCNEINILHQNQQAFLTLSEDEIWQILTDLRDLDPTATLTVKQGKNSVQVKFDQGTLHFETPELICSNKVKSATP